MEDLKFSHNWNNKLNCRYFTTLRKHIKGRFKIYQKVNILLNGNFKGQAIIEDVKVIKAGMLNDWHCGLDTGYNVDETRAILAKMYGKDFTLDSKLDFILLRFL
jgi:hypothetical protein